MGERKGERISVYRRAKLFKLALEDISVGGKIRCTGMDDDKLCCDPKDRDKFDCYGCRAPLYVENASVPKKGVIIKIDPNDSTVTFSS